MNIICDIDGVVFRGRQLIPGSDRALQRLRETGFEVWFASNNSTRTPEDVKSAMREIAGFDIETASVATSLQAAAALLSEEDHPAYVFGAEAMSSTLAGEGIPLAEDPEEARSIVAGLDMDVTFEKLARVSDAVRRGARFVATNVDPTYPVQDGVLLPGSGALVAAVTTASGVAPEIAGKPNAPMVRLLERRGIDEAWVIGDSVPADIGLAESNPKWRSLLVLTGVTGPEDDHGSADIVAADLATGVELIIGDAQSR